MGVQPFSYYQQLYSVCFVYILDFKRTILNCIGNGLINPSSIHARWKTKVESTPLATSSGLPPLQDSERILFSLNPDDQLAFKSFQLTDPTCKRFSKSYMTTKIEISIPVHT
jgi:hypothetical protein